MLDGDHSWQQVKLLLRPEEFLIPTFPAPQQWSNHVMTSAGLSMQRPRPEQGTYSSNEHIFRCYVGEWQWCEHRWILFDRAVISGSENFRRSSNRWLSSAVQSTPYIRFRQDKHLSIITLLVYNSLIIHKKVLWNTNLMISILCQIKYMLLEWLLVKVLSYQKLIWEVIWILGSI